MSVGENDTAQERVPVVTVDGEELPEWEARFLDAALQKFRTVYEQIAQRILYGDTTSTEEPVGLLGSFKEVEE